jgi:hypothetical protein
VVLRGLSMTLQCSVCGYAYTFADVGTACCPYCGSPYATKVSADATPTLSAWEVSGEALPEDGTTPMMQQYDINATRPVLADALPTVHDYLAPAPAVKADQSPTWPVRWVGAGNGLRLALIIALVAIVVGAGSFVVFAATSHEPVNDPAVPTATTVVFQAYTDPQGVFSLLYPAGWHVRATAPAFKGGSVKITDFSTSDVPRMTFIIAASTIAITPADVADRVAAQGGSGYLQTDTLPSVLLKGIQWQRFNGTFTFAGGKRYVAASLLASQNGQYYLIVLIAPVGRFATANNNYFMPMFQSLSLS